MTGLWPSAQPRQIGHDGAASARHAGLLFVRAIARALVQPIREAIPGAELIDELADRIAAEPPARRAFESKDIEPADEAADRAVERLEPGHAGNDAGPAGEGARVCAAGTSEEQIARILHASGGQFAFCSVLFGRRPEA